MAGATVLRAVSVAPSVIALSVLCNSVSRFQKEKSSSVFTNNLYLNVRLVCLRKLTTLWLCLWLRQFEKVRFLHTCYFFRESRDL